MDKNYEQMHFDDYRIPYIHRQAGMGRKLRPGDRVRMVDCPEAENHAGRIWFVASEPWEVCGVRVVRLEGYSGCFDCECLELV